jgi:hypothetical protein
MMLITTKQPVNVPSVSDQILFPTLSVSKLKLAVLMSVIKQLFVKQQTVDLYANALPTTLVIPTQMVAECRLKEIVQEVMKIVRLTPFVRKENASTLVMVLVEGTLFARSSIAGQCAPVPKSFHQLQEALKMVAFVSNLAARQILTAMEVFAKTINANLFAVSHRIVQLERNASTMHAKFRAQSTLIVEKIKHALMALAFSAAETTKTAKTTRLALTANASTLVKLQIRVDRMHYATVTTI